MDGPAHGHNRLARCGCRPHRGLRSPLLTVGAERVGRLLGDGDPTCGSLPTAADLRFTGFFFPLLQSVLGVRGDPAIRQQGFQGGSVLTSRHWSSRLLHNFQYELIQVAYSFAQTASSASLSVLPPPRKCQVVARSPISAVAVLVVPKSVSHWTLTTLREKLIKIGAKVTRHSKYVTFQVAKVAVLCQESCLQRSWNGSSGWQCHLHRSPERMCRWRDRKSIGDWGKPRSPNTESCYSPPGRGVAYGFEANENGWRRTRIRVGARRGGALW